MIGSKKHYFITALTLSVLMLSTSLFASHETGSVKSREMLARIQRESKWETIIWQTLENNTARKKINKPNWEKAQNPELERTGKKKKQLMAKRDRQETRSAKRKNKTAYRNKRDEQMELIEYFKTSELVLQTLSPHDEIKN